MEYKQFYRRKLPHRHSPGATLFVTFRLAGSIPKSVVEQWKQEKVWLEKENERLERLAKEKQTEVCSTVEQTSVCFPKPQEMFLQFQRRWFAKFEDVLHKEESNVVWLKNENIADMIAENMKRRDREFYKLICFCIMSNHVHAVFTPLLNERSLTEVKHSSPLRFKSKNATLGEIMQSLKGCTAREANKILNRAGKFWEIESYDHEVRNGEELDRIVKYVLNNPVKAGLVKNWRDWRWSFLAEKTD